MSTVAGLVLAAGRGSRMGRPKALVRDADGTPWLEHAVTTLSEAGCNPVVVVLGAEADAARALLATRTHSPDPSRPTAPHAVPGTIGRAGPARVVTITATDWEAGLGASLRAGILAVGADPEAEAVLVTLVDLPDLPVTAAVRVLTGDPDAVDAADAVGQVTGGTLRQAVFGERPGHPVLIGRDHWTPLLATLRGDRGAGPYLVAHGVERVACGDLWDGRDHDLPAPGLR